jgi:cytochrome b6-f complex iron-sulfur subunit
VKDILAAARKGGPAKPDEESASPVEPVAQSASEEGAAEFSESDEPAGVSAAPEPAAPAAPLGRPLTLKEKLAAARAGAAPPSPSAAPRPAPKPVAAAPPEAAADPEPEAAAPPAAPLGRPMTLAEKLAAARVAGAKPAPAAGAKPAAAKAAPVGAAKPAAAARTLPPLDQMRDPLDVAEAARRTGASKAKAASASADAGKPAKVAKPAEVKVVPPRPSKTTSPATAQPSRRQFFVVSWIVVGWATFTAGLLAATAACGRFMFPNVLAEPPSTIKVGVPTNFEPDDVNERWKAEWGFWIVRSTRYNGQDTIVAIQSVCTHLGCPPNWLAGEQKFKCPCHGSGFYISGVNFEGPAPRPLERFKVTLADDGQIVVDKSQKFQEEMGQWTDPDSFIAV